MQPIDMPSRSLKAAIDFLALVTTGFWPAIAPNSFTAPSMSLLLPEASPKPILIDTFSIFGTAIGFLYPKSFVIAGITLFA